MLIVFFQLEETQKANFAVFTGLTMVFVFLETRLKLTDFAFPKPR